VLVPREREISVSKVEPYLFKKLEPVLGASYFQSYRSLTAFTREARALQQDRRAFSPSCSESRAHPIITFTFARGCIGTTARAHGRGREVPPIRLASTPECPRRARPLSISIKSVEVVDELTALVTYKRLYQPRSSIVASS